jgi:hypothetical protein
MAFSNISQLQSLVSDCRQTRLVCVCVGDCWVCLYATAWEKDLAHACVLNADTQTRTTYVASYSSYYYHSQQVISAAGAHS